MREEYAAPDTDSPVQPSAWQLRFGKKSASRSQLQPKESKSGAEIRPHSPDSRSPSIADQLLRALDAKPKEQEEWSRECVDQLIGRRNAFGTGPELRLRSQAKRSETEHDDTNRENTAAEAKEIIRVRFQIENQADALRQASGHQKHPKRRAEAKYSTATQSSTSKCASSKFTPQTDSKLRHTPAQEKKPRVRMMQTEGGDNQKADIILTKDESKLQRKSKNQALSTGISSKRPRLRQPPPRQLPMERRQQLLQQARNARKLKAAEEKSLLQLHQHVTADNNKEEIQEQRRIEEQIERLTVENQQAVTLEERFQSRKERLETLCKSFEGWQQYLEYRREQEIRVVAELRWRALRSTMTSWKRYTHRQRQIRAAEEARLKLVREQQLNEHAKNFHRLKCLSKWFYQWTMLVAQQKEQRAADGAAERRKAQTERLMERLLRQKTLPEKCQEESGEDLKSQDAVENTEEVLPQTTTTEYKRSHSTAPLGRLRQRQRRMDTWSGVEGQETPPPRSSEQVIPVNTLPPPPQFSEATLARTSKRADKVYKAMEQRANERKQRREELKRRYEELEQQKRKEQEEQRAAREAILFQQRIEEKERIRERKLAEARAQQEKRDRRDQMLAQLHKANKHNRRRLLFFYALLPWRKHHALNQRVARNATRWHELRTVYSHWGQWQQFVLMCRKRHRRREQAQMDEAAKHHARSLQRRALWGLVRYHQATEARALTVRRQNHWNSLQHTWRLWYKRLVDERTCQREVAYEAATKLQQAKLRRIFFQWRQASSDAKLQRELEHEKRQLWRKVRGWLDEED
ncbi:hypothetical protein PF008_g19777 [Phytophthora fragariae]|uniref:Sfi1 spindle body domain-containing protein n=1 Tax=Phytophthora fragariae TaxID=53985 RepID=A0A6G0R1F0_9STRA|nr:hypothetical protein PF008_g19777 [Phytophthora fragariae]